jgi:hypothetical protein
MATQRPDIENPAGPPPLDAPAGPTGVAATGLLLGALIMVAIVIIPLVLVGGWVGVAIAVTLMIGGIFVLTRYVQRIAWTRKSPRNLRRGLAGMNDDLAITDAEHAQLSPHDIPLDNPGHRELLHRQARRHGVDADSAT